MINEAQMANILSRKFYDLSVLNAAALDRLSPTSDDLLNDSDEGLDEDRVVKVIRGFRCGVRRTIRLLASKLIR